MIIGVSMTIVSMTYANEGSRIIVESTKCKTMSNYPNVDRYCPTIDQVTW